MAFLVVTFLHIKTTLPCSKPSKLHKHWKQFYDYTRGPGHEICALGGCSALPVSSHSPGARRGCPTDREWAYAGSQTYLALP